MGGTLATSSDAGLGSSSNAIVLQNHGTLEATASFSTGRLITAAGGTLSVDKGQAITFNGGGIGGSGLTKGGGGSLVNTPKSLISGALIVQGGTFSLSGPSGALPNIYSVDSLGIAALGYSLGAAF